MTRRDKARKLAQAHAHAERRDDRQPNHKLTADQRRIAKRDARREARANALKEKDGPDA